MTKLRSVRVTVNRDVSNWVLRQYVSAVHKPISSMIDVRIGGMRFRAVTADGNVLWYEDDVCFAFDIHDDGITGDACVNAMNLWDNAPNSLDAGHSVVNVVGLHQLFEKGISTAMSNYQAELANDVMRKSKNAKIPNYWPTPPEDVSWFKTRMESLLRSIDHSAFIYRTLMNVSVENAEPALASV